MMQAWVLRSHCVLLPDGQRRADVLIRDGKIEQVLPHGTSPDELNVQDFGDLLILPGLVDTHVHLNEPGRTEWEGFETGTSAARAGGFTTLIDMPLNSSPVTTTIDAYAKKRDAATGKLHVDVGFHAGLVPENATKIRDLIDVGAVAVKAFLCESGIDEFGHCGEAVLRTAMPILADAGVPLLVHAEQAHDVPPMTDPCSYRDYLATRPRSFEKSAIEMMIRLARETGCHVHIVHLSDADCLPMIAEAKGDGIALTVETCPHYLFFDAESIEDRRTDFKCAPPIREAENRERLWEGLRNGLIDMIVSDHSPCTLDLKELESGRFDLAWGGISSLQYGFSIVHTEAMGRGFSISDVVKWMSVAPAQLIGLPQGIVAGHPAHLAIVDPSEGWIVDQNKSLHRNRVTPYHGFRLKGQVVKTFVHGDAEQPLMGRLL